MGDEELLRSDGLFLLLALHATVPIISYICVPSYGLFCELKSFVVVNENKEEISEISPKVIVGRKQKGKNIFNFWFIVLAYIVCLRLLAYSIKLPKTDTIITEKVRMNH